MSDFHDQFDEGPDLHKARAEWLSKLEAKYSELHQMLFQAQMGGDGSFGLRHAAHRLIESRNWMREDLRDKPEGWKW